MSDVSLTVMRDGADRIRAAIAADLGKLIAGEVRFTQHDRMLYATDASIYQVEPIGVIVPRHLDDVRRTVEYCYSRNIAILPRGGGTALAGQSVNEAVIIDFSAHCTNIIDIDPINRTATVEPGVILAQLNQALQQHGLLFGPDVATATHANIGGMIGNNSAGARSIRYGRTVESLLELNVLLASGERMTLSENASAGTAAANLTKQVADAVMPIADLIDQRFPKILRRCGGYNLDLILAQIRANTLGSYDRVNLAHLLCGSEGTLAVTMGAKLRLVQSPRCKGLAIIAFAGVEDALRAVGPLLETEPAAVELVDDVVIGLARQNNEYRRYVDLMPRFDNRDAEAVLYVEYIADNDDDLAAKFARLQRQFSSSTLKVYSDAAAMNQAWKLRAAGEPLLHGLPGVRKPLTFVEDAAVDPSRLCEFVTEFRRIVESHGTTAAYYAHASVGCLHVRPMINLRDPADAQAMHSIAEQVTDLAQRMGGSHSGEHGDGRLRSHLLERFYGSKILNAFRAVKAIFDPGNLLNPGNIVTPLPMQEHLRVKPHENFVEVPPVKTFYNYDRDGGFGSAVEMCNGAGVCRKRSGGTMCPSYRATLDERHATRGRGNALRLAITGQLSKQGDTPQWNDAQTLKTLDLCLSCKACKSECPSNVDIAKLKAEYLAHSYDAAGSVQLRAKLFGNIRAINRLGSAVHPVSNRLSRPAMALAGKLLGLDSRRSLPRFDQSLYRWFDRRMSRVGSDAPAVVLFPDCFTVYNEPHIGRAAVHALESCGYRVILPRLGCCGRSMISVGMLREAQQVCARTAAALIDVVQRENAAGVVGCEPSCVSAIVDDWPELQLAVNPAALEKVVANTMSVEDFVETRCDVHPLRPKFAADDGSEPVLLHGHCHQKALWGMDATVSLLSRVLGERLRIIDSGCCGMAGSFGYTADHYDLSMRIGELSLMPAIRAETEATVLAPGTSCRHQIKDATGRKAMHPIELIHTATRE